MQTEALHTAASQLLSAVDPLAVSGEGESLDYPEHTGELACSRRAELGPLRPQLSEQVKCRQAPPLLQLQHSSQLL